MEAKDIANSGIEWISRDSLVNLYGVPDTFLREFVAKHGDTDTRKLGAAKQARRMYRIAAINREIERRTGGAK